MGPAEPSTYEVRRDRVLRMMGSYPQGVTGKAAALHLNINRAVLHHVLVRMVDEGLLSRELLPPRPGPGGASRSWIYRTATPNHSTREADEPMPTSKQGIQSLISKFPGGFTRHDAEAEMSCDDNAARESLRRAVANGVLKRTWGTTEVGGRLVSCYIYKSAQEPKPILRREPKHGPTPEPIPAPPAEAPSPATPVDKRAEELAELLERGRVLLATPSRAPFVGPHPDVEMVLLRVALYHLENA